MSDRKLGAHVGGVQDCLNSVHTHTQIAVKQTKSAYTFQAWRNFADSKCHSLQSSDSDADRAGDDPPGTWKRPEGAAELKD